jgi:hypothetical protein
MSLGTASDFRAAARPATFFRTAVFAARSTSELMKLSHLLTGSVALFIVEFAVAVFVELFHNPLANFKARAAIILLGFLFVVGQSCYCHGAGNEENDA